MKYKWGDLITLEYGKPVADKTSIDGLVPVYGTNGQIGKSHLEALCSHQSFILGRKGAYRGVHYSDRPFSVIDTAFFAENLVPDILMLKWAYYKFLTYDINGMDSGSAIPSTDRYTIYAIDVDIPPIDDQERIVCLLSSLDAQIANNKAINHHLEALAQAIFKSWFVDFEPWGGKMPKDWKDRSLSEICDYSNERTDITSLNSNTYISTENMIQNKGGFITATSLPATTQTTAFTIGDTLISNIRPYFKKITFCEFTGGCSTDVLCFHSHRELFSLYVYNLLYRDSFFEYMVAGSKGTKMPRGDKQQIMKYPVVIPTDKVLYDFLSLVKPISKHCFLCSEENTRLAALRDTLLPRLMSGELSLADVGDVK